MGISRFEKFAPVDFNLPIFTPNFDKLEQSMAGLQKEYDTGLGTIKKMTFKNLESDAEKAQKLRAEQEKMVNDITDAYVKNVGSGRSALSTGIEDLSRDFTPGGQRYAINKQVEVFNAWDKEQQERVKKGDIRAESHKGAREFVLNNFAKIKGTTMQSYGDYNTIDVIDINKYVDTWETLEKFAKDWKAKSLETGKEELGTDGFIHGKSDKWVKTNFKDMMTGVLEGAFKDDNLMAYLKQNDMFKGQEINYGDIYVTDENGKLVLGEDKQPIWNTLNPLVHIAKDVVKKHTIDEEVHKTDLDRDPFWIKQQEWAREDEKEREQLAYNAAIYEGAGGKTDINPVTSDADIKKRITFQEDLINRLQSSINDAAKNNSTPAQVQDLKHQMNQAVAARDRYAQMEKDAIAHIAPKAIEYEKTTNNAKSRLANTFGKTIKEIDEAMKVVDAAYAKSGLTGYATFNREQELAKALGIDYNKQTSSGTGGGLINGLYSSKDMYDAELARTEKGRNAWYANQSAGNDQSEYWVTTSQINTYGTATTGVRQTAQGSANQIIKGLPANLVFTDPNQTVPGANINGAEFRTQLQDKHEGAKFKFDESRIVAYHESAYVDEYGNNVPVKKALIEIPYVDAYGTNQTKKVTMNLATAQGTNVDALLKKDLQNSELGRNFVKQQQAESSNPSTVISAYKDYPNLMTTNMVIRSQNGKAVTKVKTEKIVTPNTADSYNVKFPDGTTVLYEGSTALSDMNVGLDSYYKIMKGIEQDIANGTTNSYTQLSNSGMSDAKIQELYNLMSPTNK